MGLLGAALVGVFIVCIFIGIAAIVKALLP